MIYFWSALKNFIVPNTALASYMRDNPYPMTSTATGIYWPTKTACIDVAEANDQWIKLKYYKTLTKYWQVRHDQLQDSRLLRTVTVPFAIFPSDVLKYLVLNNLRMPSELKYTPCIWYNIHAIALSRWLGDTIPITVAIQCNYTRDNKNLWQNGDAMTKIIAKFASASFPSC